jgi:hypothetical protein
MRDGDGTSMLFRFAESVVNIAHIGKVNEGESHPHNAFRSSDTSPNFLISLCDEFNLRLER